MDEFFDYIKEKKQDLRDNVGNEKASTNSMLWHCICKSKERIQKIVDSSIKANQYYSDVNPSYQDVSYFGEHFYFRDKSHTFTVEGINSDIRKYIAALQRRSKCFFRSLETFKVIMSVFVHTYNKFGQFKLDFPHLKSAATLIQFLSSP